MGQRGTTAAFMPNLFVFPGGAVDPADALLPGDPPLTDATARRLAIASRPELVRTLPRAAIRELWEETGLMLGRPAPPPASGLSSRPAAASLPVPPERPMLAPQTPVMSLASPAAAVSPVPHVPPDWQGFYEHGLEPDTAALRLFFRAVTPPGRPRRFDARFFLACSSALAAEDHDPSGDELAHLQWLTLPEARALPLPFITEVVLSEVEALLADPASEADRPVPFFHQSAEGPRFTML